MATTQQSHMFKYGQSSILVHNHDFEDGYSNGLLGYLGDEQRPLTDMALYECHVKNILEERASKEWNAGYILGAILNLLLGKRDSTDPDAPQVQLGAVTLRLNNWRFRDAFYVGKEDYQVDQNEQERRYVVTASDLLRFIAHRDPDTKRYYFTKDEVNAIEDMLGRFTGFLCSTLFSQEVRHNTEPLPEAILQDA